MKICGNCEGYGKHPPTNKEQKENKTKPCRKVSDSCKFNSPACSLFYQRNNK